MNDPNAERIVTCWNSHDALVEACRAWERAIKTGEIGTKDLGSSIMAGEAVELTKAALELAGEGE